MKRILVTGGAGYIGSACTKLLLEKGYAVIVVDNLAHGKKSLVDKRCTFFKLDLAKDNLDKVFAQPIDAVIHFAAYKSVEESMVDAVKYADNVTGTINLLNAMVKHKVKKIIFSSTAAVYGTPAYVPLDEHHPTVPENFYGETKLIIESLLSWYHAVHGFTYIALRYFNVVGDMLRYLDPDPKNVVPIVMEVALGKRKECLIFGDNYDTPDGTCVRDYIDVHDLVRAHVLALKVKESYIINLGTEKGTSVRELITLIKEVSGKDFAVKVSAKRLGDPAMVVASNKKAKEVLGWEPQVPLKESLEATWKVYAP
jgi:UDP-glucose 4-epimerase